MLGSTHEEVFPRINRALHAVFVSVEFADGTRECSLLVVHTSRERARKHRTQLMQTNSCIRGHGRLVRQTLTAFARARVDPQTRDQ